MLFKCCFKCGTEKPLHDYYRHSQMADGHLNKCKSCAKADVGAYRAEHIDSLRAYDRARGNRQPPSYLKEYRQRFPKKSKAVSALNRAVRSGKVIPEPCFICGERAEAHHPDYDQPLAVVWLCPPHHKQAHAMSRAA